MKIVQISKNGSMDDIDCNFTKKNILKVLTKHSKSQGNQDIKLLYTWNYGKYKLLCYGWCDGEHGFENKHDLVPGGASTFLETDSSEQLLFGDLFIVRRDSKYISFEISNYAEFYNYGFGGFDECESDNESVNTVEDDCDYIQIEDESSDDEMIDDEDDPELEEDQNVY